MLEAPETVVRKTNDAILKLPSGNFGKDEYIPRLLLRLSEQYDKADNGTLVALVTMNYLQLREGESIYIPADGIHAYLSGDIIECMARSNNVLNTGFCPRADRNSVDMFTSVLTFIPHDAKECILPSKPFDKSKCGKSRLYSPPLSEFNLFATNLSEKESEVIGKLGGPSVMVVTHGEGTLKADGREYILREGYVFFIAHSTELELEASKALKSFTAYAE